MVSALIFCGHLIFILYIFTKKWQDESLSSAFINLSLIIILFSVGWSISTTIVKIFFDAKGFGLHFDSDTISLTILTIAEYFFYKFYYREKETTEDGKEK